MKIMGSVAIRIRDNLSRNALIAIELASITSRPSALLPAPHVACESIQAKGDGFDAERGTMHGYG